MTDLVATGLSFGLVAIIGCVVLVLLTLLCRYMKDNEWDEGAIACVNGQPPYRRRRCTVTASRVHP